MEDSAKYSTDKEGIGKEKNRPRTAATEYQNHN